MLLKTPASVIIDRAQAMIMRAGTRDPEDICTFFHVDITEMDLQQKIKAYYFYQSRINNIVIDQNIDECFRRVLLAHELGHFCLHREIAMMQGFQELEILEKRDSAPMETEANLFAAELLLDDEEVLSLLKEHTFFETASILRVPAALLDFKFSLLQHKGYALQSMDIRKADFLKEVPGAYSVT